MTTPTTRAARWRAHFISFWTGQAVSLFGTALVQFALVWWLTSRTHSATVLATASLAAMLPGIVLAPIAKLWMMTNGPIMAMLQATVAPDMQGRVFSLTTALTTAMVPLGLLVAGPVADAFGVQSWYLLAGGVGVLMGAAGFFLPALVHLE